MIYDLLKKNYPQFFEYKNYSKSGFIKFMKSCGFSFDVEKYNKSPQAFKLQYKSSLNSIKEDSRKGQKKTVSIRNKNKNYNPKQSLEYWIKLGLNKKEAQLKLDEYKKSNSPFSETFYLKRGYTEQQAKEKCMELYVLGALASLKKTQKPKTENIIKSILEKENIHYVQQYPVSLNKEERSFRKRKYVYDFYLPDFKTIIECNRNLLALRSKNIQRK